MPVSASDLNDTHKKQVEQFETFFKRSKKSSVGEIEGSFDDNADMKMLDDMYSRDDAMSIVKFIQDQVQQIVETQFERDAHMKALYLKQLLDQAQEKGQILSVGLDVLGDINIADAEKIGVEAGKASGKLSSMGGESLDPELIKKMKTCEEKAATMQKEFDDMSANAKSTLKENASMKHEIVQTEEMLDMAGENGASLQSKIDEETKARHAKIEEMKKELAQIQEELSGNIRNCAQFKQIKGLIMEKNKQVKEAREKLKTLSP